MAEQRADSRGIVLRLRPWHFVILVACGHLLFAALCIPFGPDFPELAELMFLGAWYMQPVLFAQWLVIGSGRLTTRFQLTVLSFALLISIGRMVPESNIDREDVTIRIVQFLITAIAMSIIRAWLGWRIALGAVPVKNDKSPVRFSVRSLLIWTAFWAAFLVMGRFIWTHSDHSISVDLEEIAIGTSIFALVFGPLAFVALSLLSTKGISGLTVGTAIIWSVATIILILVISLLEPSDPEVIATILLVSCGGTLTVCMTALPLRLAGYRLVTRNTLSDRETAIVT